ncbi:NADase-type glycan-binding domain-containing protein [Streptomyces sp. NPDC055709]
MGSAQSGRRGWHVESEQDVCPGCGVVAYPGEMFCVSCGSYMGWDLTGSDRVVAPARPDSGPVWPGAAANSGGYRSHDGAPSGVAGPVSPSADPFRSAPSGAAGGSGQAGPGSACPRDEFVAGSRYPEASGSYPGGHPEPVAPYPGGYPGHVEPAAAAPWAGTPDGWSAGPLGDRTGRTTDLTGELSPSDPLFTQAPTAPAPPTARPQPARPRTARHARQFTAPYDADTGTAVGYPGPSVGYPTAASGPAAGRPQVISGEVVLRTSLPDEDPAAEEPRIPYTAGDAIPADGIPHLLLCPGCGEPNAETRTYCHPCGALLRPEPEPPELTRWQRIRQEHLERPDVWHWDRRWGVVAVALPVCMAAGMAMGGAVAAAERAVPLVKDRFLSQYAVAPDEVSASSSAKGFDANLASDGMDNKAWAPKETGQDAVGQYWTAQFNAPFRLTSLLIVNGASRTPGQFFETGRPTRITVTAATTDRGKVVKEIRLGGQPGPQRFDLGIDNVMSVDVKIESVHPGLKPNMPVAMAEIQFFSRQEA